ncbi:MAG: NAD-dependent succinate-semialdehyde dehydrogenase [Salinigranum sp.]
MQSVNPATGAELEQYETPSDDDIDAALARASETFAEWRERPIHERQAFLPDLADVLRENEDRYAELMTREMGKPISGARAEVEKCAWLCEYYAERAAEHLQDETIGGRVGAETSLAYQPLGIVLAVMPWNYPFWQVLRFAVPALTAGNVGVLKHASNVPGSALAIQEAFEEAGYPEGAFTSLLVGSDRVDSIIEDDRVRAVTLTGSEPAGRAVAETAGRELKKTVLELGGSDPFVVLDDAPIEETARVGGRARTVNAGQSCIAAKRFIVLEEVYDEFLDALVAAMDDLVVGDPMDEEVDVGPQARGDLMESLHDQVRRTVEAGATVELGGEPLDREGSYYPPTVLSNVPRDSAAATEELFGPVAPVFRVADEEEAIELANDTRFGLGASVWTADPERGERIARRLDAGMTFVNQIVQSDPRLPFGGVKDSGYGRELGRPGIREFVNRKTVWVEDDVESE